MKTINEIRDEIKSLQDQMNELIIRRNNYCDERNEFGFNCMSERIANVLSKIDSLKWVISE